MAKSLKFDSPHLPFLHCISGDVGLTNGELIIIKATPVEQQEERIAVNLTCGDAVDSDKRSNIALHWNVRFDTTPKGIVLNTLINDVWQHEKVMPSYLHYNEPFELRIIALADKFNIFLNSKHFCDYPHQIPLNLVNHLHIYGCCRITSIEVRSGSEHAHDASKLADFIYSPHIDPPVPHEVLIPRGVHPTAQFLITGVCKQKPTAFTVNFFTAKDECALHFNVRFTAKPPVIVRNTHRAGVWEEEERAIQVPNFPFRPGGSFDLKFVTADDEFLIFIDGAQVCTYKHRVHPQQIHRLQISGDVKLTRVHV